MEPELMTGEVFNLQTNLTQPELINSKVFNLQTE